MTLTQSLANELKQRRITVNAVLPTVIDTPANRQAMPNADHSSWLLPEEVAAVILFLVSAKGSSITGNLIALEK
jgi:NAD(P)-dependent dehydrogenase (short-subunit alcohol dehydrogenase family)